MDKKIALLFATLKSDEPFFRKQEKVFIDDFTSRISTLYTSPLPVSALNTFGSRLYSTLFRFEGDPRDELYTFAKKTMENNVDFKPVATHALLQLLRNYLEYVISQNRDIVSIKALVELVEIYLITIEKANADIVKSLKEQISQIHTSKNLQEQELILYTLKSLLEHGEPIKLLAYQNELPVICRASLVHVSDTAIEINIERCFKSIFSKKQDIYIKNEHFPKTIGGDATFHIRDKNILRFKNLHFVDLPQESRRFIRTSIPDTTPVTVASDSHSYSMRLKDVSVGGLGLIANESLPQLIHKRVLVSFNLIGTDITAEGEIKYMINSNGEYHFGIEFLPNKKVEEKLSEYVTNRQFEILKELKQYN